MTGIEGKNACSCKDKNGVQNTYLGIALSLIAERKPFSLLLHIVSDNITAICQQNYVQYGLLSNNTLLCTNLLGFGRTMGSAPMLLLNFHNETSLLIMVFVAVC